MYTSTAQAIITGALQDLGVIATGQTPAPGESEDGLIALNLLADALGIDRLTLYKLVRTTKTWGSGVASYTIGTSAGIDVARPTAVELAGLILDTTETVPSEIPLHVLSDAEYAAIPQKTLEASQPSAIWYDRGFDTDGYGKVYAFPIPDVATTQVVLYTPGGEVSQFADLTTSYKFPSGYVRALRKNLALELAPQYPQAQISSDLRQQARDSKTAIKLQNIRSAERACDPGLLPRGCGRWNIESGGYR